MKMIGEVFDKILNRQELSILNQNLKPNKN